MRRSLHDDSDDDLVEQERAFLHSGTQAPAATAKRIGKQQQRPQPAKPKPTLADDVPALPILGEVVEKVRRPREGGSPAVQSQDDAAPREAFPKATHRKASKFSLARKAQAQPQSVSRSSASQTSAAHAGAASSRRQAQHASNVGPQTESSSRPTPSAARSQDTEGEEATVKTMMRENDAFIAKLSTTEIRHLKEEIQTSLKPELLTQLAARRRQPPPDEPIAAPPAQPEEVLTTPSAAPAAAPHPLHQRAANASAAPARQRPQRAAAPPSASAARLSALVRTRFATNGLPVGWLSDAEVASGTAAADVAMRDPLRRDEGSVATGYTVEEAVLLLGSTHPHLQRAALKTLAAVAWRSRPRLPEVWQPLDIQAAAPQHDGFTPPVPAGAPAAAAVPWRQVWAHLLHESLVAAPVLQLLQWPATVDASVRAEALGCLEALLSVPWELRVLSEFSWGRPFQGWPMTPSAALRRRVPAAPWQMAAEPVLPDGDAAAPDALTVLESDTLLGALFMGLLPSLATDLRAQHTAQRRAALDVVFAVVSNGPEACLSILACMPLLQALRSMMVSSVGQPGGSAAQAAQHVRVLEVVQLVAASSPEAARGIADAGLLQLPCAVLLSEQWPQPSTHPLAGGAGAAGMAAVVVGCVRLWRACVTMRVFFTTLDDTFPCVLALLAWAQRACREAADGSEGDLPAEEGAMGKAAAPPLYVPGAAAQRAMHETLQGRDAAVQVAVADAAGMDVRSSEVRDRHAWAIAQVAIQEIALLVTALLQYDIPPQAQQAAWMERPGIQAPEGSGVCGPMCSPGCMQQLVPHLVEYLGGADAAMTAARDTPAQWPAAAEWQDALRADAAAPQRAPQQLSARQQEDAGHQPPQPPGFMHAALLQPQATLQHGAVNACLLAVDALATPRSPQGLPVVADRTQLLSDAMSHDTFSRLPEVPEAAGGHAPALQQCLQAADACEAAAVRAAVCARAASAARRAGSDASTGTAAQGLAHVCVRAARMVAGIGASAVATTSVGLAFGPWAAVRTHATHLVAAGMLRCLRMLATLCGDQLQQGFVSSADMLDVLRALVLVPTLTASADTARQAMQLLFAPALVALCSAAAARALGEINHRVTPEDAEKHMVPGPALLAAYGTAWTGGGATVPLPAARRPAAAEPVSEVLPCVWMDAASGAGQRLPAPPDWIVLAVAARVDTAQGGEQDMPSAGELSAAVLAAAAMWVVGLVHAGACRPPEAQPAPALSQAWHRQSIVMGVLRMVYLTADAALGQRDAHNAIMEHLLASDALRLAVRSCMHTLAWDPVLAPPVDANAALQGPGFAMHVLRRLGQLSLVEPGALPEAGPVCVGHSGGALADVAEELAQQYASCSLGDDTFGHAVLLMCRPDWGCGERVWRALRAGGALATLPRFGGAVGGGTVFVAAAAQHVADCTGVGALRAARLRAAAPKGAVSCGALWEGCWDSKLLHRCSAAGSACAAGVLWGAWLLGAICESCRSPGAGGDVSAAGRDGAGRRGAFTGLRWQLQLVGEWLVAEGATEAAAELLAVAVVWVAAALESDAGVVVQALEHAAGEQLQCVVGVANGTLSTAVVRQGLDR
eukprot:jgi/Ulvmu1/2975/UM015_0015.1